MLLMLSILAAVGCALCNGLSAVLQKIGADRHPRANSLHPGLFWRLSHNIPYVSGLLVDVLAWVLTMAAVHNLPLFVVQPITGVSVVVTALIEWLYFGKKFTLPTLAAIGLVLLGLLLIASQATVQTIDPISGYTYWGIVAGLPILLILAGLWLVRRNASYATTALAAVAGIGFGSTAIAGRMLQYTPSYWHVLYQPTFWSLVIDGVIGVMLFTVALQRDHASTVNAAMITFETLIPVIVGLALLGDRPKGGSYIIIILGSAITLGGTLAILYTQRNSQPALATNP